MTSTSTTADAGRYGEAIPVNLVRGIGRINIYYSTTATHDETDEPVRLGWIIKDGRTWNVYATAFAAGRSDSPFVCEGRMVEKKSPSRREAIDALAWHVCCHGRTHLVSEVR